ncbi:MAG TPA: hypothetical protein VN800_00865 [Candidatus Acidoferrales bacterium]|nr:hypothetical protein [Candidatus Acidoferrales bacterium]
MDGVVERNRRGILAALTLALLARAALGFADLAAISQGGVFELPMPQSVVVAPPSPLWPALFALLALGGAVGLPIRAPASWMLAIAACVGYIASGIADLGMLRPGAPLADPGFWAFFVANLVVPAVVLAALAATRAWFRPAAGPARLVGRWAGRVPRRRS